MGNENETIIGEKDNNLIDIENYETVIGLEVHIELATKTKIFCGCKTSFGGAVNAHTCPVCTGMPGALPVLNKKVVEYAIALGRATNCEINKVCGFDRKNCYVGEGKHVAIKGMGTIEEIFDRIKEAVNNVKHHL